MSEQPGGLHDHLRTTPGRRARLNPAIVVVVVAPATAVAGAATTPVELATAGARG